MLRELKVSVISCGSGELDRGWDGVHKFLALNDSLRSWASNLMFVGSFEAEKEGGVTQILTGPLWLQSGRQVWCVSEDRETWQESLATVQVSVSRGYTRVVVAGFWTCFELELPFFFLMWRTREVRRKEEPGMTPGFDFVRKEGSFIS